MNIRKEFVKWNIAVNFEKNNSFYFNENNSAKQVRIYSHKMF